MLDVKEAAQRASEYFYALYKGQNIANVQLEEVEITEDGQYWLITLSYPQTNPTGLEGLFGKGGPRDYKVFKIDAKTGDVKSMKIRKVN